MRLAEWIPRLASHPLIAGLIAHDRGHVFWSGIPDEARAPLIAAGYRERPRKTLILTATHERCLKWQAKLQLCGISDQEIRQLPDGTSALFEDAAPEHLALSERIGALHALTDPEPAIILAAPGAALERTLPRELLEEVFFDLYPGQQVDMRDLVRKLDRLGYEPAEPVRIPGQYSVRGGILDVFVSGGETPIRLEFFGDEIESIRTFDPASQRSTGRIPGIRIAPSRETLFPEDPSAFLEMIGHSVDADSAKLDEASASRLREMVLADLDAIRRRAYFDRLDLYRPLLHPDSGCAVDLLGEDGLLVLDEPFEIAMLANRGGEELGLALAARASRGEILPAPSFDYMVGPDHLSLASNVIAMGLPNAVPEFLSDCVVQELAAESMSAFRGRAEDLAAALQKFSAEQFSLLFCTDQPNRSKSVLSQVEIFPLEDPSEGTVHMASGNLGGGFVLTDAKIAWITDAELFGVARLRLPQKRFLEGSPVTTVMDLKPGDYVVHIQFGIGVYQGLVKRVVDGVEREFLYIAYAPPDKLFVPADQLDRVQKYLNTSDVAPKINRLTGSDWQKAISKARDDAREFAQDLVKLYAKRNEVERRPFGPDTTWQGELETTFPWIETPSQMLAIQDVKRDLQSSHPMDRLVCGDVGFGKTEVAIRGAFKVVQEGRQVAVLCPTTILSEQHFRTFSERMDPFGVRIAVLNRFRTASERAKTLSELKSGSIDVIIGTHALLSKEIVFKDLGLVVIDEEQKFGVKQKEVLKHLRTEVDVLSMSATPIPRTLSMALMDIRQMSLINDPPPGRLPVRSFVRPYSKEVVREAILRELARGGQVFYVYNRVQGIYHVSQVLQKLVPHARIGVGHGQMKEEEIEPIMIGFIKGEIDVLVSTSIIENGIDISNANTLIVDNADRFGLSQLYQLKGRVGRSDRQAYSYFLYDTKAALTDGAMHRLQALQEFGALGAGYSLAFRDLQIRGAGELLGAKQSGSMASVGYELFMQLIQEQVALLKSAVDATPNQMVSTESEKVANPLPAFDIPTDAFIPDTYIRDTAQRLYCYQQMMKVRTMDALGEVRAEISDRYGHFPQEVEAAFRVLHLRILGQELGIEKLEAKGGRIAATIRNRGQISPLALSLLTKMNREAYFARDQLIWPYSGDALVAVDRMVGALNRAAEEANAMRVD